MSDLSLCELNSIRETITCHQIASKKLSDYSNRCSDPHIKNMFGQAAHKADDTVNNLLSML